MPNQKPWDKYEIALLIDTCEKISGGSLSKKDAISKLSKMLRLRASNLGDSIDDVFRNENGIGMQMEVMQRLLKDQPTGLTCSLMFRTVAKLFQEDREQFDSILSEAIIQTKQNANDFQSSSNIINETSQNRISSINSNDVSILFKDSLSKEDELYLCLKSESEENRFGTTSLYLANSIGISEKEVLKILAKAEWARSEFGRFKFVIYQHGFQTLSFPPKRSLAYTKPIKLSYFQEDTFTVNSWKELLSVLLKCLYEDYPHLFSNDHFSYINNHIIGQVGDRVNSNNMKSPYPFSEDAFIDLNLLTEEIVFNISWLISYCNIDFENVKIIYTRRSISNSASKSVSPLNGDIQSQTKDNNQNSDKREAFSKWLINQRHYSSELALEYVKVLGVIEVFAKEQLSEKHTLFSNSKVSLESTIKAILSDQRFIQMDNSNHKKLSFVLRAFSQFNGIGSFESQESGPNSKKEPIHVHVATSHTRVLTTMQKHFHFGFALQSPIELNRFKSFYLSDHKQEYPSSDEKLLLEIQNTGFEYSGKVYYISPETKKKLILDISSCIKQGLVIIYYELYYNRNEEWLYDECIFSHDMLSKFLKFLFPIYQYKQTYFILRESKCADTKALEEELVRVWGESATRSLDELSSFLPYIPLNKIRRGLSYSDLFVWNSNETYANKQFYDFSDKQISIIQTVANQKINENGYVSFDELPIEDLISNNYEFSENANYDIIFSRCFSDDYSRNLKIITKRESHFETGEAIINYCRSQQSCSLHDLEDIMKCTAGEIRYPIIIEAANSVMVRISKDQFVSDDSVFFDSDSIDKVLDDIVLNDSVGLKEVASFASFPSCGLTWNLFLLESYCRRFSKNYKYMCHSSNSDNAGAIVKKTCNLDYHNIMSFAVARSPINLSKDEVFNYLLEKGYILRKRYGRMDELIKQAITIRGGEK